MFSSSSTTSRRGAATLRVCRNFLGAACEEGPRFLHGRRVWSCCPVLPPGLLSTLRMAEWIYFIHAPREDFAVTMTDEERAVWGVHFERLQRLLAEGTLILAGPTLGPVNTGICVIEADDEEAARRIMEEDPAIASGIATGELRPFRVALLRGAS
jgi:uncharacterized protein YciI